MEMKLEAHLLSCYSVNYYFVFMAVIRNAFCVPVLVYLLFLEHTVIVRQQFRNSQISLHFEVHRTLIKLWGCLQRRAIITQCGLLIFICDHV